MKGTSRLTNGEMHKKPCGTERHKAQRNPGQHRKRGGKCKNRHGRCSMADPIRSIHWTEVVAHQRRHIAQCH